MPLQATAAAESVTGVGGEAARKSIHVLLSLIAAAVVWRLPAMEAAIILAAAAAVALTVEAARLASARFGGAFEASLGPMLRPGEHRRLTGASSLSLGYTLAAVLLPGTAALAGILFTGLGDAVAAVVGRRWGRHRYPGGKSLEGSLAFLTVAFGVCMLLGVSLPAAAVIAVAVTIVEAPTLPVDDNLFLPIVGAAVFGAIAGLWG